MAKELSSIQLPGESDAYDLKDKHARSKQVSCTLDLNGWTYNSTNKNYTQTIESLTYGDITCGSDGSISPIVHWQDDVQSYQLLTGVTIEIDDNAKTLKVIFTVNKKPTKTFNVTITDIR